MHMFAHVKWFVDENHVDANPLTIPEWFVVGLLLIIGVGVLWAIHRYMQKSGIEKWLDTKLKRFAKLIPYIVRYTTGILLLINAAKGLLFAPNVPTHVADIGSVLSIALAIAGIMLIIGFKIRIAAWIILLVYGVSLFAISPIIDVLDHIEYAGIGLYLLLFGNAKYEKRFAGKALEPYLSPTGLLRASVGIGLMILALSEKLIGIANSTAFLQQYHWNFLFTIGVTDRNFIIVAGMVELLVGLTLVLNIAPRLTTAIVAGLMTMTAILLGVDEIFGHLFVLSLVAVVWLNPHSLGHKGKQKTS